MIISNIKFMLSEITTNMIAKQLLIIYLECILESPVILIPENNR